MPKKASIKTQKARMIKELTVAGSSGVEIQKALKARFGSGVRSKRLYAEIRSINEKTLSVEESLKHIPKKYRKETAGGGWVKKAKLGSLYRGSLIISSVPLHSKPFDRHYLGFRLTVFGGTKDDVRKGLDSMKKQFLGMVADKLKSYNYAKEQTMGKERISSIAVFNPENFIGKWFFAVEEKGKDIDSEEGYV